MKSKKILTMIAVVFLLSFTGAISVFAEESDSCIYINPMYADVICEDDLLQEEGAAVPVLMAAAEYCATVDEAAEVLREQLVSRVVTATINCKLPSSESIPWHDIFDRAIMHTGVPTEGDYLRCQYGGWSAESTYHYESGGYKYRTLTYTITYYTTAEQEEIMDDTIDKLLAEIISNDMTDYQKICAIYNYICGNVNYDYENLDDSEYKLKYTAYAALINKTSVCQGYAALFYRMALETGIDNRAIRGYKASSGGGHAWNIVLLDGLYYNVDATWDAGYFGWVETESQYPNFLKCDANFFDHTRRDEFSTETFYNEYPMSSTDYSIKKIDMNRDGVLDSKDVELSVRYFAGWEKSDSVDMADINNDGSVTRADAMILARYIGGWTGYEDLFNSLP